MKVISLVSIFVSFFSTVFSQVIFTDNFDSYTVNNGLAYQSSKWETWSEPNGGNSEDAKVIDVEASSPYLSALFYDGVDVIHKLGNKTQGKYQISFNMFIRAGAYFNIEHEFKNVYALNVWFDDSNDIWFNNGTDSLILGKYTHDVWHNIMLDIDLGNDLVAVLYDSVQLGEFVFSHSLEGVAPSINLDVIDFFGVSSSAPDFNIVRSNFLIDDFKYIQVAPLNIENNVLSNVTFFPNPTTSLVTIDLSSLNNEVNLLVRDVNGKVVSEHHPAKSKEFSLKIDGPSGVYFIELQLPNSESQIIKIVKN